MMYLCLLIFPLLAFIMYPKVSCEFISAVVDLTELLDTEKILIDNLQRYIEAEEQKLEILRKYADIYKQQHYKAIKGITSYISDPINAYTLIKRLSTDRATVELLVSTQVSDDFLNNLTYFKETKLFPTDEDLNGAVEALTRLQDTYKLNTSAIARGELNGVKYSTELTASDCFVLGRLTYNNDHYSHAWSWMKEAEDKLNSEKNALISRSDILEYLALSTYKQGDLSLALHLTNELLEIIPTHSRALENKIYLEAQRLANAVKTKSDNGTEYVQHQQDQPKPSNSTNTYNYESLCRGEIEIPEEVASKLKCRYVSRNPFSKIAPFKVEEAYLKPDLFIFYDVMSDDEIETVRRLALPKLQRAGTQTKTGLSQISSNIRINKSAWLKDQEHKHIADLSQRVEDMTGLSMKTAENLQVANYGIGGHYQEHYDFPTKENQNLRKPSKTGQRIATVLFYMSDVPQGGATVFPRAGAAVWPKKGSAAFWYNLHPSGDGNVLTKHAACPVLVGSKWISIKWIHEREQEFRRPCTLERPSAELTI